jgi:hypothetical protein
MRCEKRALFYNLDLTKVYVNFDKCYSLTELYIRSLYLNSFWRRGRDVHETFKAGASYKSLGTSDLYDQYISI